MALDYKYFNNILWGGNIIYRNVYYCNTRCDNAIILP